MRASQTLLLERPGIPDATAPPSRSANRPQTLASDAQRSLPGWENLASGQQDALSGIQRPSRATALLRLEPLGHGLVERLIALEREPRHDDAGIWYPMDRKSHLVARGAPIPEGLIFGSAPPQFDHYEPMSFRVKPMTSASEALIAFFIGPTITECGSVIVALQYGQLLVTLGAQKFDKLFGSANEETHELLRMCIHSRGIREGNPLGYFVRFRELPSAGVIGDRPLAFGDQVYIGGVPHYIRKHPAGAGSGWNVVYCGRDAQGRQLFHGFGLKTPMTESEIRTVLVEHFNRDRTEEDLAFIERARSSTVFDLAGHDIPETAEDREGATHGFRQRSVRNFDDMAVTRAAFSPVEQTHERMIGHVRDQLGVEIVATVRRLQK